MRNSAIGRSCRIFGPQFWAKSRTPANGRGAAAALPQELPSNTRIVGPNIHPVNITEVIDW